MANPEHVEILKQGVEVWNKWREENPDIRTDLREVNLSRTYLSRANLRGADLREVNLRGADLSRVNLRGAYLNWADLSEADLSRADLSEVDLNRADLSRVNLRGADLSGADLSRANLSEVNLSEVNLRGADLEEVDLRGADLSLKNLSNTNLSRADLSGANLRGANLVNAILTGTNLDAATLIMANLSESDISGANLNDANISQWKIEGIKCTHINWKGKKLEFNEGEFEKAFTTIENTIEIILDLPFSELGYHTGRIIQELVNQKYGDETLLFKGQTAISDDTTKYEFVNFGHKEKLAEIHDQLKELQSHLNPVIIEAKAKFEQKGIIGIKDEVDIPFVKGLIVRPKEVGHLLNERYLQMHPLLQKIVIAVQSAIQ